MQKQPSAIDRSNLPPSFISEEQRKSSLILEANLLHYQGEYEAAADKFAEAATIEEELASQLQTLGNDDKAFIHHFSALSCWVQAGDIHRARLLGEQLLGAEHLSASRRQQVSEYLNTLRQRFVQWMSQWKPVAFAASD